MSLTELWNNSRDQFLNKQVQQVIAFAGEGKLRDGNVTSLEFRDFLSHISSDILCQYAENCLSNTFTDSGLALQDIVNQVGKRLDFEVEDGRYQGSKNNIGNDGLWCFPSGHHVVIEVKTTDAYRIDSNKIADYRKKLIATNKINEEKSSILIVVGRQDTGDLEAQIRGSRHAWDIRLISVDSLLRLMLLKEKVDDPQIIQRICDILIPKEFTRLDSIVDIVFSTAEEAKQESEITNEVDTESLQIESPESSPPAAFHDACIERFSLIKKISLIKQSRNKFTTPDKSLYLVCAVSKFHEKLNSFWFAFHPHQKEYLKKDAEGFLLLGCGSKELVLAIPFNEFESWLNDFWTTEYEDRMYWHIRIHKDGEKLLLDRKQGLGRIDISKYEI
jgi:hypothetical protein